VRFEVEVEKNEAGDFVARAVEYDVSAKGRTETEALTNILDALTLHFKKQSR
jgi:predicted RNase H-like HicB family nuclease